MVDVDQLHSCLNELHRLYDTKVAKEAVETLLKIHRNILEDEDEIRYRKIKCLNPTFLTKVWSLGAARDFMHACGWLEVQNILIFNSDEKLVDIIKVLLEHRFIVPKESEWEKDSKCENLNYTQEREEELRKKAILEREKELEEFKKDKVYRENLNKTIKAQIAEDRQKERKKFTQPVVGNKLKKGAKYRSVNSQASVSKDRNI